MAVATPVSTTPSSCASTTIALAMILFGLVLSVNGSPAHVNKHYTERSRDMSSNFSEQFSDISDISVSYFNHSNESSDNSSNVVDRTVVYILEEEKSSLSRRDLNNNNNNQSDNKMTGCPKCRSSKSESSSGLPPSEEEQETVRRLRLEMAKAQILSKLGLEAPPAVTRTQPLPDAVTSNLALLDTAEPSPPKERESTKIIIAKTSVPCPPSSPRNAVCFIFPSSSHLWHDARESSSSPSGAPSTALHLWLSAHQGGHQKRNPHVTVTRLLGNGHHHHPHLPATSRRVLTAQAITSGANDGWVHVNLTRPTPSEHDHPYNLARRLEEIRGTGHNARYPYTLGASSEINSAMKNSRQGISYPEATDDVVLEVTCRHCERRQWGVWRDQDQHQPFLEIQSTTPILKNSRSRRSAQECNSSGASTGSAAQVCCRESMYISFSELGWDDWIIQPAGFTLYYCKGSCTEPSLQDVLRGGNTYDGLLQRILLRDNLSPSVRAAVAPCCSAQTSEPLSIIWLNAGNAVSLDHLPNMVVTQCGCSG